MYNTATVAPTRVNPRPGPDDDGHGAASVRLLILFVTARRRSGGLGVSRSTAELDARSLAGCQVDGLGGAWKVRTPDVDLARSTMQPEPRQMHPGKR